MSDTLQEIPPSPLVEMFTREESDELATLMLSFDGGMLDYGELDGFLSALAVAPQATTLERWWTALFGPEPQWEAEGEEERARALVERYYAMVQARVTLDLDQYRVYAIPPLEDESSSEAEEDDYAEDDDVDDLASPAHHAATVPESYGGSLAPAPAGEDEDDDLDEVGEPADFDEDEDATPDLAGDEDEDEDEFAELDEEDVEFAYGETWLSGFRYALSLQADDWRRVLDEEPPLARWLYALWVAADAAQGEGGPLDALPVMAPTAAAPEDAGFLTLEAALRERAAQFEPVEELDEDGLMTLLPILLQQLWRRHREHATAVEPEVAQQFADCLLSLRDFDEDQLFEMLRKHAGPDGMGLERLDGYWSAQQAAGLDVSPMDSLDRIFGKNKVWDDAEEASDVLKELVYHWFRLGERLRRKADIDNPLCEPFIDFPIQEEPSAFPDRPYGQDFAQGFIDAVEELPKSAQLVLMDPEAQHWMAPLDALATGRSLAKKGARLGYDERMSLIAELPECIAELGRFWTAGNATPREPVRVEPLPGRNDPCPCGSGRKYKKCHGAPERLN